MVGQFNGFRIVQGYDSIKALERITVLFFPLIARFDSLENCWKVIGFHIVGHRSLGTLENINIFFLVILT